MRRSLIIVGLGLAVCFAPAGAEAQESHQFLIELTGSGPADLAAAVEAAGGTLVHELPDIGAASETEGQSDQVGSLDRHRRLDGLSHRRGSSVDHA